MPGKSKGIRWLGVSMTVGMLTGCLSPHGGPRLPFAHESKPKPIVLGGDGRTYQTAFRVRHINKVDLEEIEDNAVYRDTYGWKFHMNPDHIAPPEAEFRRSINRARQSVGKRVYDELTFIGADGQYVRRYFDITNIVRE